MSSVFSCSGKRAPERSIAFTNVWGISMCVMESPNSYGLVCCNSTAPSPGTSVVCRPERDDFNSPKMRPSSFVLKNAQIAILDLDQLTEFMDSETMQSLEEMQQSIGKLCTGNGRATRTDERERQVSTDSPGVSHFSEQTAGTHFW